MGDTNRYHHLALKQELGPHRVECTKNRNKIMVRLRSGKLALRRYLIASITTLLYSLGILERFEF